MKPLVIPVLRGDLINQVLQYIRECPGSTSNDMAKDLGAKKDSVYCSLASLRNRGLIATQDELVDGLKAWELSDGIPPRKDERSYVPKQQTVTAWPAVTCAKQNIFSALGL